MRLIDGDKLYELLKNKMVCIPFVEDNRDMFYHNSGYNCAMTGAYLLVEKQHTIDAVPVVRGKWIKKIYGWSCSECNESFGPELYYECGYKMPNFCPNCGCDMRGDKK